LRPAPTQVEDNNIKYGSIGAGRNYISNCFYVKVVGSLLEFGSNNFVCVIFTYLEGKLYGKMMDEKQEQNVVLPSKIYESGLNFKVLAKGNELVRLRGIYPYDSNTRFLFFVEEGSNEELMKLAHYRWLEADRVNPFFVTVDTFTITTDLVLLNMSTKECGYDALEQCLSAPLYVHNGKGDNERLAQWMLQKRVAVDVGGLYPLLTIDGWNEEFDVNEFMQETMVLEPLTKMTLTGEHKWEYGDFIDFYG
jgi:hypothetical protein